MALKKQIPKEQEISIISAWRDPNLWFSAAYYVVSLKDTDFPSDIEVRIKLSRGNEGEGIELNPLVYEKIKKDKK